MAIIGYARVSTARQSLDVQLSELSSCSKVFQEKESGAKATREQLELMLEFVRDADTVMVTKLCRLARNTRHLLEIVEYLDQKKVALKVLNLGIDTSTSTGRLMLTMIGAVAAFERELLLERQAEGIAAAKRKGKYLGRKPTAMVKADEVKMLITEGISKKMIAESLGVSLSSIYRICRPAYY
jgi:DNA invertase Pin-like site-specific DNA recombinase